VVEKKKSILTMVVVIFGGGFVPFDGDDVILVMSLFMGVKFCCGSF